MIIVVCLDLEDGVDPVEGLVDCTAVEGADITLLHVVDTVERTRLEDSVRAGVVRPSLRDIENALDEDERAALREIYDKSASILRKLQVGDVRLSLGSGRPERVIVLSLIHI